MTPFYAGTSLITSPDTMVGRSMRPLCWKVTCTWLRPYQAGRGFPSTGFGKALAGNFILSLGEWAGNDWMTSIRP